MARDRESAARRHHGAGSEVPAVQHRPSFGSHDIAAPLAYLRRRQLFHDFGQPRLNFAQFGRDLALMVRLHAQNFHLGLGDSLLRLRHIVLELALAAFEIGGLTLERQQARLTFQPFAVSSVTSTSSSRIRSSCGSRR